MKVTDLFGSDKNTKYTKEWFRNRLCTDYRVYADTTRGGFDICI